MTSNRTDRQQANDDLLSKPPKTNHRKILDNLLDTVRKQKEIMGHLLRDLEFFRKTFKTSLEYDSGAGDYREETADGTEFDIRSSTDAGDGTIKEETVVDYIGYRIAMDNFQLGFDKTKNRIEEIWKDVDVDRGSLKMQKVFVDSLEKGRKAATQE
ncbi:hypothetical protein BU25DRAFT_495690 [Macroventuria anomochaeta]|uniref:Uncharacterized protein n=1 Tax=Macroventuria anomochaeta TaxID=301207 RepID=A0ACB6RHR7_9PLEO|nr:uncharacterized protein BU25DRAFT_495690 [Macroventuria anomochaeta]KAF2621500.1 hypothetical protein BU25DRAFT_495690 [Macroventuria anomochaeta]